MMTSATVHRDWVTELDQSRERVLAAADTGRLGARELRQLADHEAALALDLEPMPADPAANLEAAHAWTRPYLERLTAHDPSTEVFIEDLDGEEGRSYTPRKPLRRVLDHALDHLNQIDQWLAWQVGGAVPSPTDGWVGSFVTLPEDHAPLSAAELEAWLWRIDLVIGMTAGRAGRAVLFSLPRRAFAGRPPPRYVEASRRLRGRLHAALVIPTAGTMINVGPEGGILTPAQIAETALSEEQMLLRE